jgi:hypothetical protein
VENRSGILVASAYLRSLPATLSFESSSQKLGSAPPETLHSQTPSKSGPTLLPRFYAASSGRSWCGRIHESRRGRQHKSRQRKGSAISTAPTRNPNIAAGSAPMTHQETVHHRTQKSTTSPTRTPIAASEAYSSANAPRQTPQQPQSSEAAAGATAHVKKGTRQRPRHKPRERRSSPQKAPQRQAPTSKRCNRPNRPRTTAPKQAPSAPPAQIVSSGSHHNANPHVRRAPLRENQRRSSPQSAHLRKSLASGRKRHHRRNRCKHTRLHQAPKI